MSRVDPNRDFRIGRRRWSPDPAGATPIPRDRDDFDGPGLAAYLELFGIGASLDEFCRVDPEYYSRRTPRRIDRAHAERHFMEIGWRLGLDPHAWFDTDMYLGIYPDVAESGTNPFEHFLIHGWKEHRIPSTRATGRREWRPARQRAEFDLFGFAKHLERHFPTTPLTEICRVDEAYYRLSQATDLDDDDSTESHFHATGWRRSLNPNRHFDTRYYLLNNDDVRAAGIDPFEHFLLHGWREGRRPIPDRRVTQILDLINQRSEVDPLNLGFVMPDLPVRTSGSALRDLLTHHRGTTGRPLAICFGHDNYLRHIGGIQMIAGIEQRMFDRLGFDYLYVFPTHHRLALAPSEGNLVEANLNGTEFPARFTVAELFDEVGEAEVVVVHSLYGHSPEAIARALPRAKARRYVWWIHDYSIHCENHLLAHNNRRFCADPPPQSQVCAVCTHGPRRSEWLRRVGALRGSFHWEYLAPSRAAADIVTSGHTALDHPPRIVPHGRVVFDRHRAIDTSVDRRLRVAFVGHPNSPKGWPTFRRLVDSSKQRRLPIDFLHFGGSPDPHPDIEFVETRQTIESLGLTTRLLERECIDAVVVWSTHHETFNIVTHEAIAAGCQIVCPTSSGNIALAAMAHGRAITYADDDELVSDDSFADRIRVAMGDRVAQGEFRYDGTTASLFDEVRP